MTSANDIQKDFIYVELEAALMFCRLAEQADRSHLSHHPFSQNARKAYRAAVHFMHRLNIEKVELAGMVADAKRLKLMLTNLTRHSTSPKPAL